MMEEVGRLGEMARMLNLKFDKMKSADSFNIVSITEKTATSASSSVVTNNVNRSIGF